MRTKLKEMYLFIQKYKKLSTKNCLAKLKSHTKKRNLQ